MALFLQYPNYPTNERVICKAIFISLQDTPKREIFNMSTQNLENENPTPKPKPNRNKKLKTKPLEFRSPNFLPKKDVLSLLALSVFLLVFHAGIVIKFWEQMEDHFFVLFMWVHQLILVIIGWVIIYNPYFGNQAVPIDKDASAQEKEKNHRKSQKINAVAVALISVMIMLGAFSDMPLAQIYYYIVSLGTLLGIIFILYFFRNKSKPFSMARILGDIKKEMIAPHKTILALFMVAGSLQLYTFLALLHQYPNLPEQIVVHYDVSLTPTTYGDKSTIWNFFFINSGILFLLLLGAFFPQHANYPTKVTLENKDVLYQKMQWFFAFVAIVVSFVFSVDIFSELENFGFHVFILLALSVIPIAVILCFYKKKKVHF